MALIDLRVRLLVVGQRVWTFIRIGLVEKLREVQYFCEIRESRKEAWKLHLI